MDWAGWADDVGVVPKSPDRAVTAPILVHVTHAERPWTEAGYEDGKNRVAHLRVGDEVILEVTYYSYDDSDQDIQAAQAVADALRKPLREGVRGHDD